MTIRICGPFDGKEKQCYFTSPELALKALENKACGTGNCYTIEVSRGVNEKGHVIYEEVSGSRDLAHDQDETYIVYVEVLTDELYRYLKQRGH